MTKNRYKKFIKFSGIFGLLSFIFNFLKNLSLKTLFTILAVLAVFVFFLIKIYLPAQKAKAWWDESWHYRKPITITNTGSAQTNTQVKILNNYDLSSLVNSGKLSPTLSDLRFTDISGASLDYWIEDTTNNSADVWVFLPSLPTTGSTVYMYYGNLSASAGKIIVGSDIYPGISCKAIKLSGANSNGTYYIDPDGGNVANAFQAYCNLTIDDGGWTRVANVRAEIPLCAYNVALGTNTDLINDTSTTGIMSSTYINSFTGSAAINGVLAVLADGNYYIYKSTSPSFTWSDVSTRLSWSMQTYVIQGSKNGGAYTTITNSGCTVPGCLFGGNDATIGGWSTILGIGGHARGSATQDATCLSGSATWLGMYSGLVGNTQNWGVAGKVYVRETSIITNPNVSTNISTEEKGTGPIAHWSFDEGYGTTIHNQTESMGENGLVSWWKMDEGVGTTAMDEMKANTLTLGAGSGTWTASGKIGNAFTFDGNNALSVADNASLDITQALTLSAWIYPTASTANATIISKPGSYYIERHSDNKIQIYLQGALASQYYQSNGTAPANQWTHVSTTFDGSTAKIYLNGALDRTINVAAATITPSNNSLFIGSLKPTWALYNFQGNIDNAKVYNRALSDAEISHEYSSLQGTMINFGNYGTGATWPDGAQATSNHKPLGKSLNFDGINDYVNIGDKFDIAYTDPQTYSLWIKTSSSANSALISKQDYDSPWKGWLIEITADDQIRYQIYDNSGSNRLGKIWTTSDFNNNQWHYITVVKGNHQASNLKLYIDGIEQTSVSTTYDTLTSTVDTDFNLQIGARDGANQLFSGQIDEVKFFDYALSSSQIKKEYNRGSGTVMGSAKKSSDPGTSNLVGWWKMDEGSGANTNDSSGKNNNGTLVAAPTWTTGKLGKTLDFNGSTNYVQINDSTNSSLDITSNITISAWIYHDSSGFDGIIQKGSFSNNYGSYCMWVSDTNLLRFGLNNAADYVTSVNTIPLNTWTHVTATYNGSTMKLFINGAQETNTRSYSAAISTDNEPLRIGMYYGSGYTFDGKIDNVKIYNSALSAAQINYDYSQSSPIAHYSFDEGYGTTIHNQTESVGENGLVSWWKFDEGVGTTALDEMRNSTGTFNPTPPSWTTGKIGGGLSFGGSSYVFVNDHDTLKPSQITVSAWIKTTQTTTFAGIIDKYTGSSAGYFMDLNPTGYANKARFAIRSATTDYNVYSTHTVNDDAWHLLTGIYDGANLKMYIDNMLSGTNPIGAVTINHSTHNLYIGGDNTSTFYYNGLMDSVKIYNRALSISEIATEYNSRQGAMINFGSYGSGATWPDGASKNSNEKPLGKSLQFDGVDDFVKLPNYSFQDNWSMSAWVRRNAGAGTKTIIDFNDNSNVCYLRIGEFNANAASLACSGSLAITDNVNISDNKWHHVVGTRNGSTAYLYVDNRLAGTDPSFTTAASFTSTNSIIGRELWSSTYYYPFDGVIDEAKVFSYALSTSDVSTEYNRSSGIVLGTAKNESDPNNISTGSTSPLVAWWKMDEESVNTMMDASGKNYSGTFGTGNSAPSWTTGYSGKALSFTNDYVFIPQYHIPSTGNTFSFWINPQNLTTLQHVISKWDEYNIGIDASGNLSANIYNDHVIASNIWEDASSSVRAPISMGWHHVAVTAGGGYLRLYIDGTQKNYDSWSGGTYSYGWDARIGACSVYGYNPFNGSIDDVKIYDKTLSAAEVAYEYNQGKPVAHWNFDEKSDTTIHNQSEKNGEYGLVSWWKMDEGVGTTAMDEMKTATAILATGNSAPGWTTSGKISIGLSFDGTNDYVYSNNSSSLNSLTKGTISLWIKPNYSGTPSTPQMFVSKEGLYAIQHYSNGVISGYLWNGSGWTANDFGSWAPTAGTWYNIVFNWNGSSSKVYINNQQFGSTWSTSYGGGSISNNLMIGAYTTSSQFFNGIMDSVKIYNRDLTAGEIAADYNSTHGHMINMDPLTDHVAGKFGNALDFDGSNDYVSINSNIFPTGSSSRTVSAWIKPSSYANYQIIFNYGTSSSNNGFTFGFNGTTDKLMITKYGGNATPSTIGAPLNTWSHVTAVFSNDNVTYYVNGANAGSFAFTGVNTISGYARIGKSIPGWDGVDGNYNFSGQIDEAKIYNYGLTSTQVKLDYNNSAGVRF